MTKLFAWKTNNKIYYRLTASNGKKLILCPQGFERLAGMVNDLRVVYYFFGNAYQKKGIIIHWIANPRSKTVIKIQTVNL